MGKDWDRLWETGAGMSKVGIGDRDIPWPSHGGNLPHGGMNPTCAVCGGRLRGAKKCSCDQPHDHWKPVGKRRKHKKDESDRLRGYIADTEFKGFVLPRQRKRNIKCPDCGKYIYDHPGRACVCGGVQRLQQHRMQEWHYRWLAEVYRVLKPGGIIKVFGATRTFHRMAAAMEQVGFVDLDLEAWMYGCLPEDSEILTETGWKSGMEVQVGEKVSCWDSKTGEIRLDAVEEVIQAPFEGDLISFRNDNTDQLLTPNHRVYHRVKESWVVSEARELIGKSVALPIKNRWGIGVTWCEGAREHYKGPVWCVRVPTGAFLARRKDKIFITGNSGFPKSLNVSKALDKKAGAEREVIGYRKGQGNIPNERGKWGLKPNQPVEVTEAATPEAQRYEGFGTALKPAWEPFVVGRKPE